jgi:hypothetical protein
MSYAINDNENVEFKRIGRKHNNNKSHNVRALLQSEKRNEKISKQVASLPKKMREKLLSLSSPLPSAGHGKQIGSKHGCIPSITYYEKQHYDCGLSVSNQYQEFLQGEEDAYAEIENDEALNARDEFFEEHFRLLLELDETEHQEYLDNVYTINTNAEDMSGSDWIVINDKIENYETKLKKLEEKITKGRKSFNLSEHELNAYKEHVENLVSLKTYYDETDAHVNPEYLESLKSDIENFNGRVPSSSCKLESEYDSCDEEWMEMVDALIQEQGYY